jgi:leader peptidase (prepilin peptidase) / N-methyltransferase
MLWFFLFIFGVAIGSFLNVVALRYDGEHFLLDPKMIGGRSHCPHCKKTLVWYELLPMVSWVVQGGKCRTCKARIGWQYPIVEFLSGLIFVFIPLHYLPFTIYQLPILWTIAFEILLLIAYIDIRLGIIPDELNVALFIAAIFTLTGSTWLNHALAGIGAAIFFGALVAITRGKGMGLGDVKLALPLGLLFGYPNILLVVGFSFVIGALFGLGAIMLGKKTMQSSVPFAPFLVIAAAITFFVGQPLIAWYLKMIGI